MSTSPTPEPAVDDALDIQHDPFPAQEHGESRRIPHLGHAVLFFLLGVTAFFFCMLVVAFAFRNRLSPGTALATGVSLGVETATYLLLLTAAYRLFPAIWKRPFLVGIHWNGSAARRYWPRLLAAGILLSALTQIGERLVTEPKHPEIEQMMHTAAGAWEVMLLGTLLAPLVEEIAFRGFLLPAFATAYDWLSLKRTPANVRRWSMTTGNSQAALWFAAIFSSLLFAGAHAPQLEHAAGPVTLLFVVSLVLAYVRIRTRSVAASTVVHLTYNLTIFIAALVVTGGFRHLERL